MKNEKEKKSNEYKKDPMNDRAISKLKKAPGDSKDKILVNQPGILSNYRVQWYEGRLRGAFRSVVAQYPVVLDIYRQEYN